MTIEDRLDYYEILESKAKSLLHGGYKCLICGREIVAYREWKEPRAGVCTYRRANQGNSRGAMTNHLKAHIRKGQINIT